MKPPRGLSESEAAAWARLAATVHPYHASPVGRADLADDKHERAPKRGRVATAARSHSLKAGTSGITPPSSPPFEAPAQQTQPVVVARPARPAEQSGLDSHWERRLRSGTLTPDFTLDLHEHSLDAAYTRLLGGLDIARETGARVVLVIAGRERRGPAADRSGQRGAIRAKLLDWLAASRHASAIATIRKAHRRHGGEGALYVILKKPR
jgi:DNA-nicking Smr family endonuclease